MSALRYRLRRSRMFLVGATILLAIGLGAIAAPLLAARDPLEQDLPRRLKPPLWHDSDGQIFLLGTDSLGRDLWSRVLHGIRVSLLVGVAAVLVSGAVGVLLGLLSGYYGGRIDHLIMRITDIQLSIPLVILAIAVIAVLGTSLTNLILVIGFTQWMIYARTIRGETLSLRQKEFVEAARALGVSDWGILYRSIFLNTLPTIIVLATLNVATVTLLEAGLSFLGLGVQPPTPSIGFMLAEGRQYLETAWWFATFPGVVLMLLVLGINLVGDGLRDVLDPYRARVIR